MSNLAQPQNAAPVMLLLPECVESVEAADLGAQHIQQISIFHSCAAGVVGGSNTSETDLGNKSRMKRVGSEGERLEICR
jgi:hypothetical protein